MRSAFVEIDNKFHIIDPSYNARDMISPQGETCTVWSCGRDWNPASWRDIDVDVVRAGKAPLLGALQDLVKGTALVLHGTLASLTFVLERICRVLEIVHLSIDEKRECFSHCLVRLEQGEPSDVAVPNTCRESPVLYGEMRDTSFRRPVYVPAHLVWSLYATVCRQAATTKIEWDRRRFTDKIIEYTEPLLGLTLEMRPKILVPDPAVLDLLVAAYLTRESPLPADLRSGTVLEPCTGSGILGIAAERLGARKVISSDIDAASVQLTSFNVTKASAQNITVRQMSGVLCAPNASLLLTNPPWIDSYDQWRLAHFERCLSDPGRRLLREMLKTALHCHIKVAYVFFGENDPYEPLRHHFLPIATFHIWNVDKTWEVSPGLRLHRLVAQHSTK